MRRARTATAAWRSARVLPLTYAWDGAVPVGRLNLLSDRTRFLAAVGGVAFAVTLILMVQALYTAYNRAVAEFIESMPVDVWVGQAGAFDIFRSTTIVPTTAVQEVQSIDGVRGVWPMRARQASFGTPRGDVRSLLIAFDAGPAADEVARALGLRRLPATGEVAVSDYVRRYGGLGRGDQIDFNGTRLTVTERITANSPPFGSFSVISFEDAGALFAMRDAASYLLVDTADPLQARRIADEIESRLRGTVAYTGEEFAASNARTVREFLPVVAVLLVVSYLVGVVITSLTIYTATVEKTRDYGVLKALGASNWYIYGMVLYQSFLVSVLGFLAGLPLSLLASEMAGRQVPEFITVYTATGVLAAFAAILLMSLFSAFLPARRVGGIDPAMVFRA